MYSETRELWRVGMRLCTRQRKTAKKSRQKEEAMFLLGVMYTIAESRIDLSHPCHDVTPDWAAVAFMLRQFLSDAGGSLEYPMPFQTDE